MFISVIKRSKLITKLQSQIYTAAKILIYFGLIAWVMSIMSVSAIFSIGLDNRKRQIDQLLADGLEHAPTSKCIMYEAGLLTGLGGVLGILVGMGILLSFVNMIKLIRIYQWHNKY